MDTIEQQTNGKPPSRTGIGPVVGIIIIIILLALGGLYYFTQGVDDQTQGAATSEEEVAAIESMGQSNDLTNIEADVAATDFSGLDQAAASIDSELQAQ